MNNNYFTIQEADLFTFYRIPKELFSNSRYKHISTEAKVLYGLLLDRNQLSIKNNWVDDRGFIFIYFSREEVMEILGFSEKTVTKLFKELKDVDLIEEKRQGLGKANIIFVKKFIINDVESIDKTKNSKNYGSVTVKNTTQEQENLQGSNTNIINTEYNDNNNNASNNSQQKNVVVDTQKLVNEFREKYKADLDLKRTQSLIKQKGIDHVKDCIDTYGDYTQGRTIRNIGGDFYTFVSQGYTKPVAQIAKPIAQFNFDERDYKEEEMEKYYVNVFDT